MQQRIYLDTSVVSLHDDPRSPERSAMTRELWRRLSEFEVSISEITLREVMATPFEARRAEMTRLLVGIPVLALSQEAQRLANRYLDAAIFPRTVTDDALHVAIAVLARQDIIVS